jgi:hypothetical protein
VTGLYAVGQYNKENIILTLKEYFHLNGSSLAVRCHDVVHKESYNQGRANDIPKRNNNVPNHNPPQEARE